VTPEPLPSDLAGSTVSPDAFRQALGRFATGITVATTLKDGVDHAMTANSFASVSLEPPTVLVCVEKITRFHEAVLSSGLWAVSVLGEGARDVSVWLASRGRPLAGQLDGVAHGRGAHTGAAVLTGALAVVECRTRDVHDGGDHVIVVGDVLGVETPTTDARPLVYYTGRYHGLSGRL